MSHLSRWGRPLSLLASAFCCVCLLAQTTLEHSTTVTPLPDENILNPCEYRIVIPAGSDPINATWVIFDRGMDYLNWFQDRQVRAFATQHRLALLLAMQCRSKERDDMIVTPASGVGRALYTAIDQFAESENHPELKQAAIIAMGWSGAGSLVGRLPGYRPERFLAGIAYAPGQYDPLGMNTIELSKEAFSKPQLIIANGGDNINGTKRPHDYFIKYLAQGAPWTFAVQNRTPHCCLQNAQLLILDWLAAVLRPEDQAGERQYGYLRVTQSDVVDEWKLPVFNATASRVGALGKPKRGELQAGWMPSKTFAGEWLVFTQRPAPIAIWKP